MYWFECTVDITRCGLDSDAEDAVDIQVKAGLGDILCTKRSLGNGLFVCNFRPILPLLHRVHVLIHGYNAKGCPFDVIVNDDGLYNKETIATGSGLYLARCARSAGFTILTKGTLLLLSKRPLHLRS